MKAYVLSCLMAVAAATTAPAEETYLARTRAALAHAGTHMAEITAAADRESSMLRSKTGMATSQRTIGTAALPST